MRTIDELLAALQQLAPFETAEPWDNSGLLVGDGQAAVDTVYLTLDITAEAVACAAAAGAQLIVSHHPVIFDPLKSLLTTHPVYHLVQNGIGAVCVHTNLDKAAGGVNDCLAEQLGLYEVTASADGLCRVGRLPHPMTPEELALLVNRRLQTAVRLRAGTAPIQTVAVCGGAGADWVLPLLASADAALTGEVKHHEWLRVPPEKTLLDGGHFFTENGVLPVLAERLRERFPELTVVVGEEAPPYQTIKD